MPAQLEATGDWLLFLDADSELNPGLLADILRLIEEGKSVGCGCTLQMQGLPWWGNWIFLLWKGTSILFRWAAGALVVCRSDAFRDVGGFDQELYAADEIRLSGHLKQWGRQRGLQFTILENASVGDVLTQDSPLLRARNCRSDPARLGPSTSDLAR